MDHFYENIDGWFDFQDIYREVVEKAESPAHFVEIGSWKGKSAAFMAVEIINSGKYIYFYVVDHFQGSLEHQEDQDVKSGQLIDVFKKNIEPVKDVITICPMTSKMAVEQFQNNSLDFVFIDAAHEYEAVKKDIELWLPKIKQGGLIAGDDYQTWPGVKQAVDELLPDAEKRGIYWMQRL